MTVTVVKEVPEAKNMVRSGHLEPQSVGKASTANPVADDGDSAQEHYSGSEDGVQAFSNERTLSEKRKAQNFKFSIWMSKRTARVTKKEVQAVIEKADEDTLSVRALMLKQDSSRINTDPREYQLELFEKAKTQNTIAVLDTGSGKTLIAVLLLKYIIDIELEDRFKRKPPRISFFLVDCVTLAFQQAAVLESNLDQKITCLCGEMGCDFWSSETWKLIFAKNMVIVCTAEILYQCLMHSFITIDRINLLIFDEAHHAKKNHTYARLIKDFYVSQPQSKQPKIFGMTASPVDSKDDEIKAAKSGELETLLHSTIATASNLVLLRNTVSRPHEILLPYAQSQHSDKTCLFLKMNARLGDVKAFARHFANATELASQLGEWCADRMWAMALAVDEEGKLERKIDLAFHTHKEDHSTAGLNAEMRKLKEAMELIAKWEFPPPRFEDNCISAKVKALLGYLNDTFAQEKLGRCIVFVNKRWTARLVKELLCYLGARYIRPDLLIGARTGDAGDRKTNFRKQLNAIHKFRKGETNCLIATSVAEEGLDIPDCDLVIRFDLYTTLIQYIQSRGRARHVDSRYVHMIEHGNVAHLQLVQEMRRGEDKMRNFCEALPADRLLQGNGKECDLDTAFSKERGQRKYTDPNTGATLTYASSIVVLAHFVASLPSKNGEVPREIYHIFSESKKFFCEVLLPSASPVHSAVGRPQSRKTTARRSAAFEACILLRQKEYIDSNLLSTYRKLLPRMRNARLALEMNKKTTYPMNLKPKAWSVGRGFLPDALYMTVLELETPGSLGRPCQPLALMTRIPLPDFPSFRLHLQIDKSSDLICTSKQQAVNVSRTIVDLLDCFTLRIFMDVFHKEFESDKPEMSYWLAPIMPDWRSSNDENIIDWLTLRIVFDNPEGLEWSIHTPPEHYVNRYLIDRWDASRRFYSLAVEPDLRARDPLPDTAAKHKYMKDILDYSVSLFKISRQRATWCEEQPVYRAYKLLHRIDWLDDFKEEQNKVNTNAWLCLEPLLVSALPVSIVTMARMLPGNITRLESYLIAMEAFESFGLSVKPELALEAFTKSSDNTDEHMTDQVLVERSTGRNYERLEFIGDCFLKMATSISLFTRKPEDNEFEYHVSRMIMICNKNLLKTSLEEKTYQYIRSAQFSRRDWYPQGLKLLSGKGMNKEATENSTHWLADKTMADVCEAMIGACLLSHKDTSNMDMAVKAVTALVRSEDHIATSWADYYTFYERPNYQKAESSASHLDLAMQVASKHQYHFKWPRLLRSAFIHSSQPFRIEGIPSYQRLEFLGDALLDMASLNFLFHRYPDRDPQWLTEHKMAMVSNKFLAALSVKLGFHKHLRYIGAAIEKQNRDYVSELQEAEAAAGSARDYWTNTKQPPKALSDIVESFVGAIFVDSEFNYKEVERFFDAHIRWFFEDITIYDTFANNHPTTYLHKLLTLSFGCTNYRLLADKIESVLPGFPPTSVAALMVHDEIVADGEASSSKNAKMKASQSALKLMQGMSREEYRLAYRCDCKEREEKGGVGKQGDGMGMVGTAV